MHANIHVVLAGAWLYVSIFPIPCIHVCNCIYIYIYTLSIRGVHAYHIIIPRGLAKCDIGKPVMGLTGRRGGGAAAEGPCNS